MPYKMLVDVTRCIGCQGCQVSCKNWNDKKADRTTLGETLANPRDVNSSNFTVVKFSEKSGPKDMEWHFTKRQCMHCATPACVAACPCSALTKSALGPVEYNRSFCIGCRYCTLACPFEVPAFDWDKAIPSIQKCTFCAGRIKNGMEPACSKSCPSGALTFGKDEDIVRLAKSRIAAKPGRYVDYIYGTDEAGGTSWLYISDTDFKNLGFRDDLEKTSYGTYSLNAVSKAPLVGIGAAALMAGFFFLAGRKEKNRAAGREDGK